MEGVTLIAYKRGAAGWALWPQANLTRGPQGGTLMTRHWTLDDISWNRFDRSKVDLELLKAVKAAALVEYNAGDYVDYLKKVFADRPEIFPVFDQWGREEVQHGLALGRWAEIADPHFDFETAFAKFREGYRPAHFDTGEAQRGAARAR